MKNIIQNNSSPFGSVMNDRNYNSPNYRYGFNGKEKDDEVKGSGNSYDFGDRIYDPRLGRWLSIDPLHLKRPWDSPYSIVGNSPLNNREIDGKDFGVYIDHKTQTITIKATYYTVESDKARANAAVNVWNSTKNLEYTFKNEKGETQKYNIVFELDVKVENSQQEAHDKAMANKEGNLFLVGKNSSQMFAKHPNRQGVTYGHKKSYVKETVENGAQTAADAHEMGHDLISGDGHATDPSSTMYEATNGMMHGGEKITNFDAAKILKSAGIGSNKTKLSFAEESTKVQNVEVHQKEEDKPKNFDKGTVNYK